MKDIIEQLDKFCTEFTVRKFFGVIVVGLLAFGVFLIYERYTSSFQLSRLQKAADLLARIQVVSGSGTNSTPDLDRARNALVAQAVKAIEEKPLSLDFIPSKLTFSMETLWKFAAGGALWCMFALFQLSKLKTKEGRQAILGLLMLAGLSGFVGIFVPAIWWPWFHFLIYPWLLIAAVIIALVPVALVAASRSAKKKAQSINCVNNLKQVGLAARIWAADHNDVLPPDLESMKTELGSDRITCCPSDNSARYKILSPNASETDPEVVYAHCPVHNHAVLADGSVQQLGNRKLIQEKGRWKIQ